MSVTVSGPLLQQSHVCETILRALPDWFGLEDAVREYIREVEHLPTFVANVGEAAAGFLTIKQHYPCSVEIYVMGVLPAWHGQGIGSALVEAAEVHLRAHGVEFLQVKTLSAKHPDQGYARTRAFYAKMGFKPLEELDQIWGAENPCLLLVKWLGERRPT